MMATSRSEIRAAASRPVSIVGQPASTVAEQGRMPIFLLVGGAVLLVVLVLSVGLFLAMRPTTPASGINPAPAATPVPTVVPTPAPDCYDAARERRQIQEFLGRGQISIAVGLAENTLAQNAPPLCGPARQALASLWYAASVETLFVAALPDDLLRQQPGARWSAIEEKADAYGVPKTERVAPMLVARRAYDRQDWPLAEAAAMRTWEADHTAFDAVRLRHDALRNRGGALAFRGTPQERAEGTRTLRLAHAIDTTWGLRLGVACGDLHTLGYADCDAVDGELNDPMLTYRGTAVGR
jgi:hypothetical protein